MPILSASCATLYAWSIGPINILHSKQQGKKKTEFLQPVHVGRGWQLKQSLKVKGGNLKCI